MSKIKKVLLKGVELLDERASIFVSHTPLLDCELILCHVLGVDRLRLFLDYEKELSQEYEKEFFRYIDERLKGKPVAYIIGEQEFMGLNFKVNENVLIPRPDTEVLVEAVLKDYSPIYHNKESDRLHFADIGTGSGAIAVSLAKLIDNLHVTAFDISEKAIEVAKENAVINQVSDRLEFIQQDIMCCDDIFFYENGIRHSANFDAIISNPPYIRSEEMSQLPVSVKEFEPFGALDGGKDGLLFYKRICSIGLSSLKKGCKLYFEVGHDQSEQVISLMEAYGYHDMKTITDLQGYGRVVVGVH